MMSEALVQINTKTIKEAVFNLCKTANINLDNNTYNAIFDLYKNESNEKAKNALALILENARVAKDIQRPLCQDTGQVIVFVEIGQNVHIVGENLEDAINKAVKQAYTDNFFRKSVVKDAIFDRENTQDNTPTIIHTSIVEGNSIDISLCIKGAGSENMSAIKMLKPADGIEGIIDFAVDTVRNAGSNPCPPIMLGIGIGGTMEKAALLSKKALLIPPLSQQELAEKAKDDKHSALSLKILEKINDLGIGAAGLGGNSTAFAVNIMTSSTHIACMPVAITINCHSSRHARAKITKDSIIYENDTDFKIAQIELNKKNIKTVNSKDIETIRSLKTGEEILLSGEIYTARDAAHKKLVEFLQKGEQLPFEIKNAVIFYTGPCPAKEGEIIGPTGPTTSARMDKYTGPLLESGLLAMIGKGERNQEIASKIKEHGAVYFSAIGGIASLMSQNIKSAKIIAFPELGTEAVRVLEVENLPLTVSIGKAN